MNKTNNLNFLSKTELEIEKYACEQALNQSDYRFNVKTQIALQPLLDRIKEINMLLENK